MLHSMLRSRTGRLSAVMALALLTSLSFAQPVIDVVRDGLTSPFGVAVGPGGNVFIVEQGTGADDAQVSIVTPGGDVFPFLVGLQSVGEGEIAGTWNLVFNGDDLWITQGVGEPIFESHLLRISTTGFTPGAPPLTTADLDINQDVGAFVIGEGFDDTNLFNLTFGPGGDAFLVDSGANAIIRRDAATGDLSVFAVFPSLPNPTAIGPPFIDPVPTGIVFTGDGFLVSALTGFPFLPGFSRVFRVDLAGNVSLFRDGFTSLTGIALDPRDGKPVVLEFAAFVLGPPPDGGFQPGTGAVKKLHETTTQTLASGLNFTPALAFAPDGDLFVTSFFGQLLRIQTVVDTTPPVCGRIVVERNGPDGGLSAVNTSASDGESGIASVLFSRLVNLTGSVDSAGPFAQGDTYVTPDPDPTSVAIRGERISYASGGAIVVTVTNGAGLSARCDPVVDRLDAAVPVATALDAAYPNPVRAGASEVRVPFAVSEPGHVRLAVYDVLGREVAVLFDEEVEAGRYETRWEADASLASGTYLVQMEAPGSTRQTQRLTLVH